jgi:hypothetical protein
VLIPSDTGRAGICLKRVGYAELLLIVLTVTPLRYEGVKRGRKKKERRGLKKKKERAKSRYVVAIYRPTEMGDGVFSPKLYGRVLI